MKRTEQSQRGLRRVAYVECTQAEYACVKCFADREGLTISDFLRRCINSYLLEEGDDVPLLAEYRRDTLGT